MLVSLNMRFMSGEIKIRTDIRAQAKRAAGVVRSLKLEQRIDCARGAGGRPSAPGTRHPAAPGDTRRHPPPSSRTPIPSTANI